MPRASMARTVESQHALGSPSGNVSGGGGTLTSGTGRSTTASSGPPEIFCFRQPTLGEPISRQPSGGVGVFLPCTKSLRRWRRSDRIIRRLQPTISLRRARRKNRFFSEVANAAPRRSSPRDRHGNNSPPRRYKLLRHRCVHVPRIGYPSAPIAGRCLALVKVLACALSKRRPTSLSLPARHCRSSTGLTLP
jgi:hypothetical protein